MGKKLTKLSLTSMFTSLSIASAYATASIPNFSLMDAIVFVSGVLLGPLHGALTGALTWIVYGSINPYGFIPVIWVSTMACESLYGLAGGLIGKYLKINPPKASSLQFGLLLTVGFLLTFIYDLLTNVVYSFTFNIPLFIAITAGAPFTLLHEVTNSILFPIVVLPTIKVINNDFRVIKLVEG